MLRCPAVVVRLADPMTVVASADPDHASAAVTAAPQQKATRLVVSLPFIGFLVQPQPGHAQHTARRMGFERFVDDMLALRRTHGVHTVLIEAQPESVCRQVNASFPGRQPPFPVLYHCDDYGGYRRLAGYVERLIEREDAPEMYHDEAADAAARLNTARAADDTSLPDAPSSPPGSVWSARGNNGARVSGVFKREHRHRVTDPDQLRMGSLPIGTKPPEYNELRQNTRLNTRTDLGDCTTANMVGDYNGRLRTLHVTTGTTFFTPRHATIVAQRFEPGSLNRGHRRHDATLQALHSIVRDIVDAFPAEDREEGGEVAAPGRRVDTVLRLSPWIEEMRVPIVGNVFALSTAD